MNKKIIIIIIILVVMLVVGFWVAQQRFERVERPDEPEETDLDREEAEKVEPAVLEESIRNYLVDHYGQTNYGGRVYCEHQLFGLEVEGDNVLYYLWAHCQEYYLDQASQMQKGMLVEGPVVLEARVVDGEPVFLNHQWFDDYQIAKEFFPVIYHEGLEANQERDSGMARGARGQAELELLPGMGK